MTGWEMYWLLMLDNIGTFLCTVGGIGACFLLLLIPGYIEDMPKVIKAGWFSFAAGMLILSVGILLPSTKQMAAILVVPKIVNNEQVQQIPEKLLGLGLSWLEELKPEKTVAPSDDI